MPPSPPQMPMRQDITALVLWPIFNDGTASYSDAIMASQARPELMADQPVSLGDGN